MLSAYRDKIFHEYEKKKAKNPSFSKRAYAKFLGISHTSLIDFLSRKTSLSTKSAIKIANKLEFSIEEKDNFLTSIKLSLDGPSDNEFLRLQEDEFSIISNWIFYGILNLSRLKEHNASPDWVASYFNIDVQQAKEALNTLRENGYITIENNKIIRMTKNLSSTVDVPSSALMSHHKQKLDMAMKSIDKIPVREREISSTTMCISTDKLPQAKKLIFQFKRELCKLLEDGDPNEVYTFNIQLVPLKNFKK